MADALATLLGEYLATWKENPEGFLFLNRNGRPHASNKVVEYGLWPVLDKLKIKRAGMHAFRHYADLRTMPGRTAIGPSMRVTV
jgi:hypothetical protein